MKYSFHPAARAELEQATEYYEGKQVGLGLEFAEEVYSTIQRILQHPEAWTRTSRNAHRCLTHRFPYGVIYQEKDSGIVIIAIMHLSRRPAYFRSRIS